MLVLKSRISSLSVMFSTVSIFTHGLLTTALIIFLVQKIVNSNLFSILMIDLKRDKIYIQTVCLTSWNRYSLRLTFYTEYSRCNIWGDECWKIREIMNLHT
ncbi:hypothetical protein M758_10G133000 [Ceratodon purpureus]|nr:hypothetical protein M758_10G133000 [Ceratodon purpureus]